MNKVSTIALKELATHFKSPVAYIVLILTISVFNVMFYIIIDQNKEISLKEVFQLMEFMFIFLVPLLSMSAFAQEKSTGTMEFLMTAPLTNTAIVLGKYAGALLFFSCIIALTGVYYLIIEYFGFPDRPAVLAGYAGVWLEGAFFLSVGMLASALTRSQMLAAVISYIVLFLLYLSPVALTYVNGPVAALVKAIGTPGHLENLATGLITAGDIVYYISGILLFLGLTRLSIENRIWR